MFQDNRSIGFILGSSLFLQYFCVSMKSHYQSLLTMPPVATSNSFNNDDLAIRHDSSASTTRFEHRRFQLIKPKYRPKAKIGPEPMEPSMPNLQPTSPSPKLKLVRRRRARQRSAFMFGQRRCLAKRGFSHIASHGKAPEPPEFTKSG